MNNKQDDSRVALAVVAHPDDVEFLCAGTLALLKQEDWEIVIATMTAGDCGTRELSPNKISAIRKEEASKSAKLLEADYHCLECKDIFIMYDQPTLLKVIALMREVRPQIVFTMSPSCYMVDHEMTSKLVQTATFAAGMVNIKTEDLAPYFQIPYLYYTDPMEGKDKFGKEIEPGFVVDISSVIDTKEQMLRCHDSQRQWLMEHDGMDKYLETMKKISERRGKTVDVAFGEGFRQHLGHSYPQENILNDVLANDVHIYTEYSNRNSAM